LVVLVGHFFVVGVEDFGLAVILARLVAWGDVLATRKETGVWRKWVFFISSDKMYGLQ
jgi:hypothetical protein